MAYCDLMGEYSSWWCHSQTERKKKRKNKNIPVQQCLWCDSHIQLLYKRRSSQKWIRLLDNTSQQNGSRGFLPRVQVMEKPRLNKIPRWTVSQAMTSLRREKIRVKIIWINTIQELTNGSWAQDSNLSFPQCAGHRGWVEDKSQERRSVDLCSQV